MRTVTTEQPRLTHLALPISFLHWPLRLAGGDRRLTLEEQLGALDDRHVDHLAVDCDSADTFSQRLVIGGEDAAGLIDLLGARPKLLVQDWHLARMDHRGADKAESAGAADRRAKT